MYDLMARPAPHQPQWNDDPDYPTVRRALAAAPPLVSTAELWTLRARLARVAAGHDVVLQAGDCVETFSDCTPPAVAAKLATLDDLGARLSRRTGAPVVRVGRLGGQFAKPRSRPAEPYNGRDLPTFRGPMINSTLATEAARRPDPRRMLRAYAAAGTVTALVGAHRDTPGGPWTSHEALVLDYEESLARTDPETGAAYLASTHLPWIGERTRHPDGAHVALLAAVANPVACKVGPSAAVEDVLRVCDLLDPDRVPGRLVLIARMGRRHIGAVLPGLVNAVRRAGHPVVWLSDPMHGNTVRTSTGLKTRLLADMVAEATAFRDILLREGVHPGGLHLEVAAGDVTECVGGPVPDEAGLRLRYTSLCDPRLNPRQAGALIDAWC
ncbi:3-deoxy-7-phosphoheptulonate synthase [Micromonospora sp. NPDC005215]|uniref:3-deoxy-7-phosphoheptulonate synthase n=1 Tax=Micromonospora sp. NPDC005215 TaxID=3157024 RepID=UPI0033A18236